MANLSELSDFFGESNIDSSFDSLPSRVSIPILSPEGDLGFSPLLPIELALKTSSIPDILDSYGLTQEEFLDISAQPAFIASYKEAQELVKEEGMSFKLKAKMQAEEMLKTSWRIAHDPETPPSVRADLIKSTVRWAGYDKKETENPITSTQALQINIQLN